MEVSHLWTQDVKDELLEELPEWGDTLEPDEIAAIAAAMERTPVDTLLVMSEAEWERLNTEEIPLAERSDASLIFLLSDLVYGPNRWNDSYEIGVASGEWFINDNPDLDSNPG